VLEVAEFLKDYEDRLYLTVDDAMNNIKLDTRLRNVSDMKVNKTLEILFTGIVC